MPMSEDLLHSCVKRVSSQLGGKVEYISLHKESDVLKVPQVTCFPCCVTAHSVCRQSVCTCVPCSLWLQETASGDCAPNEQAPCCLQLLRAGRHM